MGQIATENDDLVPAETAVEVTVQNIDDSYPDGGKEA
jgi:hypothetical protein